MNGMLTTYFVNSLWCHFLYLLFMLLLLIRYHAFAELRMARHGCGRGCACCQHGCRFVPTSMGYFLSVDVHRYLETTYYHAMHSRPSLLDLLLWYAWWFVRKCCSHQGRRLVLCYFGHHRLVRNGCNALDS